MVAMMVKFIINKNAPSFERNKLDGLFVALLATLSVI
jgi:hypothetical protein